MKTNHSTQTIIVVLILLTGCLSVPKLGAADIQPNDKDSKPAERTLSASLVGKWKQIVTNTAITPIYEFREDGTLHITAGGETARGTYRPLDGNRLQMEFTGLAAGVVQATVANNQLTMVSDKGGRTVLDRFDLDITPNADDFPSLLAKAEKGEADAEFKIAGMYASGNGTAKNPKEAAKWYTAAAEKGHIEAQYNLGTLYEYGLGVEASDTNAAAWYSKAASQGHFGVLYKLRQKYPHVVPQGEFDKLDLAFLQGDWRADKVWWGGGNTEASAIDGGQITIKERKFTKKVFRNAKLVDLVATIERIDATKSPKEIDLKVQSEDGKEKTVKLVYVVDEKCFEFFWTDDGAERPKKPWYFGRTGPFAFDDKGTFYQYNRAK